jgi:hypothetical protein
VCLNKRSWFQIFCHVLARYCLFSGGRARACTCICSAGVSSYTHILAHTFENMLTEIISGNEIFKIFTFRNYFCVAKHDASLVNGCGHSGERNSETKSSRFIGFCRNAEKRMDVLFDSLCCQCYCSVCTGINHCTSYSRLHVCGHERYFVSLKKIKFEIFGHVLAA